MHADPSKEPSLGVMNTVIAAMALDYPPDKLAVYLQDDGGSYVTLNASREAWKFARFWVPLRRKYELKIACPAAYFSSKESAHEKFIGSSEFAAEKKIIEKSYTEFQEALEKNSVNASASVSGDRPPLIEVGYRYFTAVEDALTSISLHCKGWISVYIAPASPCFLGASTTNLNDMLVQ
ncbi:cellulose synthase-like protein E1 [Sesamum indicum]|uniref:Cellulose synthase-like protein E1 n=1 Tax=Sesamum indicum TaxID=4182 RepID=A0A8M8UUB3_SESIN|nr:cellulose synthase-like protein E1 [Sesamum indicum]